MKFKSLKHFSAFILVAVMVASCTSVKNLPQVQQTNQQKILSDSAAAVYLIRPSLMGFAMPYPVFCDSVNLGAITSKTYFYFSIPGGEHNFTSSFGWPGGKSLDVDLLPNTVYYIKINGSANLELLKDESKALKYMRKSTNYHKQTTLKGGIVKYK